MSRMRWVPAKRQQLGAASVMVNNSSVTPALEQMPAPAPTGEPVPVPVAVPVQGQPIQGSTGFEKIIYGGLILAGAAAFITFVFNKD